MKILTMILCLLCTIACTIACADTYIVLDKNTDTVLGTASIKDSALSDWQIKYTLIPGEAFKGKQGNELKYDNGVIRHATNEEIETSKPKPKSQKDIILEALGLTANDLVKIKGL